MSYPNLLFRLSVASLGVVLLTVSAPVFADILHLDTVIITGGVCSGFDCVDGEDMSFISIKAKENNTRIRFVDTSASSSFPDRDWELTANDTTNGGLNKFSITDVEVGRIPFTIEANAPNNALYVEADGDIGFGTINPVVELHLVDGDTPTLRLEQDGSSGFGLQTWDLAGNETNFFIRDLTNGSQLPFRVFPNAGHDILTVKSGRVGVNTDDPLTTLHVVGDATVTGNVSMGSSRALKDDLGPVDGSALLGLLSELPIHTWRYLTESQDVRHIGPMAEDFHATFGLSTDPHHLSIVDTNGLALVAVQELHRQLQAKDRELEELRQRLLVLEGRLEP